MTRTLTLALAGIGAVCGCSNPAKPVDAVPPANRDGGARRMSGSAGESMGATSSREGASGSPLGQAGSTAASGGNAAASGNPVVTTPTVAPAKIPEPDVAPFGTRELWQGYSFIVPPAMTGTAQEGGFVIRQGACVIALFPEAPATGALVTQAVDFLNGLAREVYGGSLREGGLSAVTPPSRGVSGAGWRYAFVQGELLTAEGAPSDSHLRVLLVSLGATVATIVGIEPAGNRCLDELNPQNLSWQSLFYSLDFPAFTLRDPTLLARQAIGWWQIGGTTTGLQEIYAANGRYANTTTLLKYQQYSATEVLQTTTSFSGQGAFSVSGDRLTRFPDGGPAQTGLFRIMEEMNAGVPGGWLPRLYQLQLRGDGSVSEYNLTWRRD